MGALAFTTPALLLALAALPVIWWLLRLTPPKPEREVFPPFRLLLELGRREQTPATTPWWLLLLRLLLAAAIIIALAGPVLNPRTAGIPADGPLVVLLDNGWSTAPAFEKRRQTAAQLISEAAARDLPVSLLLTAEDSQDATPMAANEALRLLAAARPRPLPSLRERTAAALEASFAGQKPGLVAFITDGIASEGDGPLLQAIERLGPSRFDLIGRSNQDAIVIADAANSADRMTVDLRRLDASAPLVVNLSARDLQGRIIDQTQVAFAVNESRKSATLETPYELRNDFARLTLDGEKTAGGTRLLDDSFKRRSVGLVSGEVGDRSQPLLSPLYYINRALAPYANLGEAQGVDLATAIPKLIESKPSVIVLADIGRLPTSAETALTNWIEAGGTLVRFAGPRLATASADDPLIPVRLRTGERALGGAMSWAEPQPLDAFRTGSPFEGLPVPDGVLVNRQVLAEPSDELDNLTWASLKDGTPLVTARDLGAGRIVLFHVSAETSWSNLPLSGSFVEMLRRIVQLARTSLQGNGKGAEASLLQPYRLLDADGALTSETGSAKPIQAYSKPAISSASPPGLYGSEDGFQAVNLFDADTPLNALSIPAGLAYEEAGLVGDGSRSLTPWFLIAAMILALADTLAMLVFSGAFSRRISASALTLLAAFIVSGTAPDFARADDSRPGDEQLMARLDKTHLAYVITGEQEVDRISERGLAGLTDYLFYRTTLEPGDPVGVDITKDELAVFPILYWPVTATAPMPSEDAISRVDAYMRSGGTVLFDTRDQFSALSASGAVSANTQRLRAILARIDIPPLEPVPNDHVLTKSFYLLKAYPGRYAGSPLWIEAQPHGKPDPGRPARAGDGVTPILITGNDFAGAWAIDDMGAPLLPLVPPDENQREMAYRTGVNIMMYMLTGNYKADQVHVPALLERLGQ
ncbi:DUF4159 domain-containing protein [Rhizobium alvei]|uniref:DUF4159 domain-containing protein n=1 Tax=Rhizobium alvei TaxID=1132659 RepID=A0ABT8YLS3_9HYPH|nr:DUF4159 domain-containing protein [Rhizobium alvei]MDO6964254.1 DUF4159 domain-containing protein [Rhizobium alvei]